MTIVNLTPARYELVINGTEYTSAWAEGQMGVTPFSEGDGILLLTGQLTLGQNDIDLDPRTNRDLFIGNEIVITRNNFAERIPLFGTMYITGSQFDRDSERASVSIGCWLSMLNTASRAEIGVCIEDQESGQAMNTSIETLLLGAGIPLANIDVSNITGTLLETKQIDEGTTFIQCAGQLAYSQGYTLYQDYMGVIKAQVTNDRINKDGSTLAINESELAQYQQKPDSTTVPSGKVRVNGNRLWPARPRTDLSRDTFTEGEFGIVEEYFTRAYDNDNRQALQIESRVGALGEETSDFGDEELRVNLSNRNTQEFYELRPVPWSCDVADEGRLYQRTVVETAPQAISLRDYLLKKAEVDGEDPRESAAPIATSNKERIEETWEYATPDNSPICGTLLLDEFGDVLASENLPESVITSGNFFIRKTLKTFEPTGAIFPLVADPKLGRDPTLEDAELVTNHFFLRESAREETLWVLNPDGQTWLRVSKFRQSQWRVRQQSVVSMLNLVRSSGLGYSYPLSNCFEAAVRLTEFRVEIDRNTTPQEPGRWPSQTQYGRTPYKIDASIAGAPAALNARLKNYTLPDETPLADVQANAETILLREFGRSNAHLINMPDDFVPTSYVPFGNIRVTETDSTAYLYEGDSMSLAITPGEAYYAGIGLLIGVDDGTDVLDIWNRGITYNTGASWSDSFECSVVTDDVQIVDGSAWTFTDVENNSPEVFRDYIDGILDTAGLLILRNFVGP